MISGGEGGKEAQKKGVEQRKLSPSYYSVNFFPETCMEINNLFTCF